MKPIHHALVSARLFGGTPEQYLPVHNAFDMSKAALGDMRHRAALHSVDHGLEVMRLIFPDRIGCATLEQVCIQHVHDDQGFSVRLDTWLRECDTRASSFRYRPPEHLSGFLESPIEACIAKWGGASADYEQICRYFALPQEFSDHPLAPAVSLNAFGIYFAELAFGSAITVPAKDGRQRYIAVRDIGEHLAMARFGHLKSLGDVFSTMKRRNWMTGAMVKRSRGRRSRLANRDDLFDETMGGLDAAPCSEGAASVSQ